MRRLLVVLLGMATACGGAEFSAASDPPEGGTSVGDSPGDAGVDVVSDSPAGDTPDASAPDTFALGDSLPVVADSGVLDSSDFDGMVLGSGWNGQCATCAPYAYCASGSGIQCPAPCAGPLPFGDAGSCSEFPLIDGAIAVCCPGPRLTWQSWARQFFATYCTSCHNSADISGRDWTMESSVNNNRSVIRCGVAAAQDPSWACGPSPVARQFPIGNGPKPTDNERDELVAWITAGCP